MEVIIYSQCHSNTSHPSIKKMLELISLTSYCYACEKRLEDISYGDCVKELKNINQRQ